ncbi:MAG: PEP-CTERM sorting domain-containing protein [Methylovulum sp.]|nr:PEP-CTERM sorting domain-containing protein [Methylovulum sp.]
MKKLILATAVMGMMVFANSGYASPLVIDSFGRSQSGSNGATDDVLDATAVTKTNSLLNTPATTSVFESRTLSANMSAGGEGSSLSTQVAGSINKLSIASSDDVLGNAFVSWNTTAPSGVDLTNGGGNSLFRLHFISADHASLLNIIATDTSSNTLTLTNYAIPVVNSAHSFDILFSLLSGSGNLAHIASLKFDFNLNNVGTDLAFNFFETSSIPEPSVITLMGLALAGMAASRRRKA